MSNVEETLKNILVQDLLSKHPAFGQVKVDTSSIVIKRDLEHTYHSESYVKEALNESMAANSPKNLSTQNSKDKVLQSRVGVVRKTTVKPNQNNKKKDTDEPDIDTENLPVVQGTFQITKTEADITENKQQNSSPSRNDEKVTQKTPVVAKTTTTMKPTTTKRAPTTTPKSRPFTIMSTLNVKTRTDVTPKTDLLKTTTKTASTTTISSTTPSTTTVVTTTASNVSQLLLDLLTNENHYKDLPKIDTLFTVPHVIDNEPWRPITKPYYDITDKPAVDITMDQAEDRIGVAEVVEDISAIEGILSPIPPVRNRDKITTRRPPGIYGLDPNLAADVYVPSPVYTSFTLPTYAPPLKNMETLGSSYPKPHPIPVDKISGVVEEIKEPDDGDDGKPVERPPKDKTTSVALNVLQFDQQDNSTEQIAVEGASIVKKHDDNTSSNSTTSTTTTKSTTISPTTSTTTSTTLPPEPKYTSVSEEIMAESETENNSNETMKEQSTRRPNNKVSIIPSTSVPHHTWELVNTSTNENDTFHKHSPEKHYNDTLQAIITKNDAVFPNTTPKFPSRVSILRNLTDIIKKYSQSSTETVPVPKVEAEERQSSNKMVGSSEVVIEDEEEGEYDDDNGPVDTTTPIIITLLPAKSNLAVNRPLRPRPKIRNDSSKVTAENQRSFFRSTQEQKEEVTTKKYVTIQSITKFVPAASEIITSSSLISGKEIEDRVILLNATESMKVVDLNSNISGNNRLPKKSLNLNNPEKDSGVAENTENINKIPVPEGTYRVSYHVTGSVSSKQANKTRSLPAYELPLEPDVVLEIPVNQTNKLTIDKLRQLASLATISDSNNNTLFRAPGGGVISTKAIPSSYTLNQAGFKILTKTYNKLQSTEQDEKNSNFNKNYQDKLYSKPNYNKPEEKEEDNETQESVQEGKEKMA